MKHATGYLYLKALELRTRAKQWEPHIRLIGNVSADEIVAIMNECHMVFMIISLHRKKSNDCLEKHQTTAPWANAQATP